LRFKFARVTRLQKPASSSQIVFFMDQMFSQSYAPFSLNCLHRVNSDDKKDGKSENVVTKGGAVIRTEGRPT
jgi:hypothetical protein